MILFVVFHIPTKKKNSKTKQKLCCIKLPSLHKQLSFLYNVDRQGTSSPCYLCYQKSSLLTFHSTSCCHVVLGTQSREVCCIQFILFCNMILQVWRKKMVTSLKHLIPLGHISCLEQASGLILALAVNMFLCLDASFLNFLH